MPDMFCLVISLIFQVWSTYSFNTWLPDKRKYLSLCALVSFIIVIAFELRMGFYTLDSVLLVGTYWAIHSVIFVLTLLVIRKKVGNKWERAITSVKSR